MMTVEIVKRTKVKKIDLDKAPLFTVWYFTCVFVLFCILLVWSCGLSAFY